MSIGFGQQMGDIREPSYWGLFDNFQADDAAMAAVFVITPEDVILSLVDMRRCLEIFNLFERKYTK